MKREFILVEKGQVFARFEQNVSERNNVIERDAALFLEYLDNKYGKLNAVGTANYVLIDSKQYNPLAMGWDYFICGNKKNYDFKPKPLPVDVISLPEQKAEPINELIIPVISDPECQEFYTSEPLGDASLPTPEFFSLERKFPNLHKTKNHGNLNDVNRMWNIRRNERRIENHQRGK